MLNIEKTTLKAGLEKPVKLLHITDTHLSFADERDNERKRKLAEDRSRAFGDTDGRIEKDLYEMLDYADRNCDLLIHTGDLIDFVSAANVEKAGAFLAHENVFFVAGNHEYSQYVGEAWEDHAYRMNSYMQIRGKMGVDMIYTSRVVNGLNIIGLDNGYYQFEDWFIWRLKREVEKGMPIIVMMHNPLYEKSLFDCIMDERHAASASLVGCSEEQLFRYEEYRQIQQRPNDTTKRVMDYMANEDKILAFVTGHVHFSFESMLPCGKMQYVTGGGYDGIAREITVL